MRSGDVVSVGLNGNHELAVFSGEVFWDGPLRETVPVSPSDWGARRRMTS